MLKYKLLGFLKKLKELPFLFMYWFTPLPRIFFIRREIRKTKKYKDMLEERNYIKLISKALELKADEEKTIIIAYNRKGEIAYLNKSAREIFSTENGYMGEKVIRYLPKEISKVVEDKIITGSREECLFKDGDSSIILRSILEKRKNLGSLLEIKAKE